MGGLTGRPAIVTGGGGAIGRAIAERLAREGAIIGVFDVNADAAELVARAIAAAGGIAHAVSVDLTDYAATGQALAAFEAAAGPPAVLVNNAGWDRFRLFLDTDPAFWDHLIAVNLRTALNVTHIVARGMTARKAGRIVTIASDAGRVGSLGEAVYSACKGGLIALTKSLAREFAARNVTVNCVCPGPTDTPIFNSFLDEGELGAKVHQALSRMVPLRRIGKPDDIPGIVAFFASDDAAYITGQVISVSGGLTMHG